MKEFILTILFLAICYGFYELTRAQSMSDEERKDLGLGPKGQGR